MERATKTSLAIKMKMRVFFKTFLHLFPPTLLKWSLGDAFVPVFMSSKHRCKRNFTVVFVKVVKKSPLDMQNLFFFIYLLGLLLSPSMSPSSLLPDLSMCVNGYESEHILVKTPAIFSLVRHVCYSRFSPLMNCFVSEMWVERQKKVRCFRKKNYFKELRRVEWIEANCALKLFSLDILLSF